jgi:hypothetical protein
MCIHRGDAEPDAEIAEKRKNNTMVIGVGGVVSSARWCAEEAEDAG